MTADPFSEILRLTEASSVVSRGFAAGGAWALHFPPPGKLKFSAIARGRCWLRLDGRARGTALEEGDVVILPGRDGFVVGDGPATPAREAHRVLAATRGAFARLGTGDRETCVVLSGMVALHPASGPLLLDVLPALVHVRGASPDAAPLRWIVEQILQEQRATRTGASITSQLLAQLLFVQALRAHLGGAGALPAGWLRALADERVTPALRLMHGDPARAWTLAELAKAAAMSRTTFAVRFKAVAGVAPLAYLARWRMQLAQRALRDDATAIAQIGAALGYGSESAFSTAFKRVVGVAPSAYRSAHRAGR